MNNKVKSMVGIGLFTAIVVVLQFVGSTIRFGVFSISLVLIPVVVGAALYSWKAGGILGFAFGMAVLLSGDATAFLEINPGATILVVLLKGTLCGLVAGGIYGLVSRWNQVVAVIAAALVCPIVNTGVFLLGCQLFFLPTITQWGQAAGFDNVGAYMILGLVGVNFLIEMGVNVVLSPVIVRLIRLGKK